MNTPRNSREALFIEIFDNIDTLLSRVDELPTIIEQSEKQLIKTVILLNDAGDRYRLAITAVTEQAKAELSDYLDNKTKITAEEQRTALQLIAQDMARNAFRSQALEAFSGLKEMLNEGANLQRLVSEASILLHRSAASRLVEHCMTAGITAVLVTSLILWLK